MKYFISTSLQDLRMDSMSYPVVAAIMKQYTLQVYCDRPPSKKVLLPPDIILF